MVRLKDRDDLSGIKGAASAGFRAALLPGLHMALVAAAPERAVEVLGQFQKAARNLHSSENAFNSRARRLGTPSLMSHLRNPAQMAALRDFNMAYEELVDIHPQLGETIARLTQKDIDAMPRKPFSPK